MAALKQIKVAEKSSADFNHLPALLGKTKSSVMKQLLVPAETEGKHKSVFDPEWIAQLLTAQNRKHFGQAQGAPFACTPIAKLMGCSAVGD